MPPLRSAQEAPKTVVTMFLLLSWACPGGKSQKTAEFWLYPIVIRPDSTGLGQADFSTAAKAVHTLPERWVRHLSFILRIFLSLQTALNYLPWLLCGLLNSLSSTLCLPCPMRPGLFPVALVPKVLLFYMALPRNASGVQSTGNSIYS